MAIPPYPGFARSTEVLGEKTGQIPCFKTLGMTHFSKPERWGRSLVRRRFGEISHLVKILKLYGVSAIGRQLSYYEYKKASGRIAPGALPDSIAIVMDTAPLER
jgi:hypothetical protein